MKIPVLELFPAKSKLMSLAVVFCCLLLLFPPARAEVWHQSNGNSQDVNPPLVGPVYDLGGGGTDVDRAIQWAIDQVRGCQDCSKTVDLVVLRFLTDEDQEAWDRSKKQPDIKNDYLKYHSLLLDPQQRLQGLDSIETYVFTNPPAKKLNSPRSLRRSRKPKSSFSLGAINANMPATLKERGLKRH